MKTLNSSPDQRMKLSRDLVELKVFNTKLNISIAIYPKETN